MLRSEHFIRLQGKTQQKNWATRLYAEGWYGSMRSGGKQFDMIFMHGITTSLGCEGASD